MKKIIYGVAGLLSLFLFDGIVKAEVNAVTPSTNEINKTNSWAYVDATSNVGSVTLTFVSTRNFYSCFEVRTDGNTGEILSENGGDNYNSNIHDGLYPYYCVRNSTRSVTVDANQYIEVRMVFGAETDERFDWTMFNTIYPRLAQITDPTDGQYVYSNVAFTAFLDDDDIDPIQWAVRQGTCAAGTNTVFGNVDGHHDVATMETSDLSNQSFSFMGDMSAMLSGMYCFIYNPVEDVGESNIRLTREFYVNIYPTDVTQCKKEGWKMFGIFKNQGDCVSYIATGGTNLPTGL